MEALRLFEGKQTHGQVTIMVTHHAKGDARLTFLLPFSFVSLFFFSLFLFFISFLFSL